MCSLCGGDIGGDDGSFNAIALKSAIIYLLQCVEDNKYGYSKKEQYERSPIHEPRIKRKM